MRIGLVSQALPYLPSRGGFRLYAGNLMKRFAARHEVELVSLLIDDDSDHLDWPKQYCKDVIGIPLDKRRWPAAVNLASGYLFGKPTRSRAVFNSIVKERAKRWDVIHVEGGFTGGVLDPNLPVPSVLSLHDAEVLRCEELLNCKLSLGDRSRVHIRRVYEKRYEKLVYPRYDRCIVVADRDREFLKRLVPAAKTQMISYGTDTEFFHPQNVEKTANSLVFHSHLGYAPNVSAALEFANDVLPLVKQTVASAEYHLIGAQPTQDIQNLAKQPGVRLSANLPDLRSAVCSGQIYVSAIRYGTGLKSKILEAMGMGMPIVCYPGSTVGLDVVHGRHLMVANDPEEFAAHVVALLRDPARAADLAREARKLAVENYSWESRARTYENLYSELIAERRVGKAPERRAILLGKEPA